MYRLNSKIRLTTVCLSGFELYSRWVPLSSGHISESTGRDSFLGHKARATYWVLSVLGKFLLIEHSETLFPVSLEPKNQFLR